MAIAINFRRFVTDDPKRYDQAKFTPEIAVKELLAMELVDLVIERPCLEIIQNSKVINRIRIINGLKEGNITRALNGEHVGMIIRKS
jgi:molybdenum storage protein